MIDEQGLLAELLEGIFHQSGRPLTEAGGWPREPGLYVLTYQGSLELYRPIRQRWPIYCGSAAILADRLADHRRNLADVHDVDATEINVSIVPTGSHGLALYAEWVVMDALRPVWNRRELAGFGSRFQGKSRAGQRQCPWSVLHPGRRCSAGRSARSRDEIAETVRAHLAEHAPVRGLRPFG